MAKRVAPDEREYRPVQESVLRSVLSRRPHEEATAEDGNTLAVIEDGNAVAVVEEPSPAPSAPVIAADVPAAEEKPNAAPRRRTSEARRSHQSGPSAKPSKRKELVREKRMLLSREEEEELETLVSEIARDLGVRVKTSNVLRACVALLFNVKDELRKQCRRTQFSKRPRYNEQTSIANFEENIARLLDTAVRNTKSYDR
ncbi:hypothetical protein [Tautonia sociabilis]|uniref:Uncharacterized protein n=1 Tax=Tautonia sociabilis TaxID=2080755 RepID=A0A432MFD6_9BACT|nr:hypothetical protein [Tautonia sociabilis]RUL84593.1 hypothetical protein TsocGM_20165 [Tautonia sociabilis]